MRTLPTSLAAPAAGCLLLALSLPPASRAAPGQDTPPTAKRDDTPSDAAALGFLRGFVDERMLHLPGQGVTHVEGVAKVLMTSAVGLEERLTYTVAAHFDTGELTVQPVGRVPDLAPRWRTVADRAAANLLETQTPLSAIASGYVVRLAREDELVRLSFTPRDPESPYRLSFWFQQDGSLVRKREAQVLAEGLPPEVTETTFVMKEHQGRQYIQETNRVMRGESCKARYEYRPQDGVLVLHKLFLDGVMDVDPDTGVPFRQPITVAVEYEVSAHGDDDH